MVLKIYTDGACSGNPGPGGWAYVLVNKISSNCKVNSGGKQETTNNEMELMAVYKALKHAENLVMKNLEKKHRIEIHTDSAYIENSINQGWLFNWSNNHWITKQGNEVKNKKLWSDILKLYRKLNVRIIKVKAHAGNLYNEMIDKVAKEEVDKYKNLIS